MIFEHSGHSLGLPSTIGSGLANSGGIDRVKAQHIRDLSCRRRVRQGNPRQVQKI
jgi:hypothetical protein